MNNQNSNVERQSIKRQKEQKQQEVLSGIIDNESKTYTFEAEITVNGKKETGSFTAKYLGIAARLRIGTIRAKLLDGAPSQSLDTLTDDIAYMIAYLQVSLIKFPKWWDYDVLEEYSDLRKVYNEVYKFNQSFRGQNGISTDVRDSSDTTSTEDVEN